MGTKSCEADTTRRQAALPKGRIRAQDTGQTGAILFEGPDAAGTGGTIRRFVEHLDPGFARVGALNTPAEVARGQWFFQRYDRSLSDRADDARGMGFHTTVACLETMRRAPEFERMLVRSGIRLYTCRSSVTQAEPRTRFLARETDARATDPLKRWKPRPIDRASRDKWDDDTGAKEAMFFNTDTARAPWVIGKSNDEKHTRLKAMRHFLSTLDDPDKDPAATLPPDPLIVGRAAHVVHRANHIFGPSLHPARRAPA